ncbi:hypothetical protein ACHAW5_009295 [Stephanodiscus triporus]|uniref:J domain-containing protein n=1 Tax=Stephanodiscus triporus TaxID=2934178 RepID=A0ABD3NRC1_9STRA
MAPFFDAHGDPTMDPYTILSLPPTATEAEIKRSYRMQMLQLHPDKLSPALSEDSIAAVSEKFHNVKDAYEFLVSPLHLTSRRMYMAKMASRRAGYERREAFLRRNGRGPSESFSASVDVPRGYAYGGGGAAGMAGTGFSQSNASDGHAAGRKTGNNYSNSYAVPPSRKTSHPESEGGDREKDRGRRSNGGGGRGGVGQPRYYTNSGEQKHSSNGGGKTTGRSGQDRAKRKENRGGATGRVDRNGYKSDSHAAKSKPFYRSTFLDGKEKHQYGGRRGKSEEPAAHREKYTKSAREGGKRTTARDKLPRSNSTHTARGRFGNAKDYADSRETKDRRQRARSAPARCADARRRDGGMKGHKHYPSAAAGKNNNLPKEFFCHLTKKVMKDPVRDDEGNVYEREAIERWLRVQSSSPITNRYLSPDMIRPDKELKRAIYKATGKPRSKSQARAKSPNEGDLVSGRVLIDSYLREISSHSKLNVSLDGIGICAFSYRRTTFVIEVPITPHAGFMVYSSFDGEADMHKLCERIDAWNDWLSKIGRHSSVHYIRAGRKTVFSLKGSELDMAKCEVFQKTLEYFVEMTLKVYNLFHPLEMKAVENVCLTRHPVAVT